jgi:hypothetical protein
MKTEQKSVLKDDGVLNMPEAAHFIEQFVFWRGASGARVLATVFDLQNAPDLTACVALLVRKLADGSRVAIAVEQLEAPFQADAMSLLAYAKQAGATELHLHFMAQTPAERRKVFLDLKSALMLTEAAPLISDRVA